MLKHAIITAALLASLFMRARAQYTLKILHMNDHHSTIEEDDFKLDTSAVLTSPAIAEVKIKYGGFPRAVTYMNSITDGNVLKLHAGDAMTGTLWYSLFKGSADAKMMGYACFHAFALGNHEFDDGDANLADFLKMLEGNTSSCAGGSTKVLAANVVPGDTSPLKTPTALVGNHTTFTINGEKVGVVGIDVKGKTEASSSPSHGTTLTDELTAAQASIDALKAAGVNKIILLTHVGLTMDEMMAPQLSGVDVIVGGDSHTLLGDTTAGKTDKLKAPAAAYPKELTNKNGNKVCIVQAWEYAHAVGHLEVTFNSDGNVTGCTGGPRIPVAAASTWTYDVNDTVKGVTLSSTQQTSARNALDSTIFPAHVEHTAAKAWITSNRFSLTASHA